MRKNSLKTGIFAVYLAILAMGLGVLPSAQASLWLTNNPMNTARQSHTATLLQNGKILVAGGYAGTNASNSAELYDPTSGTWSPTGSLNIPRGAHAAILLGNGKVLVVGGYNTDYLSSAELYDPVSGTWVMTGSLHVSRFICTATLMMDGKVLVAGGTSTMTNLPTAEVYDPVTELWTQTGNMHDGRAEHTATLLPNGTVLVAGGYGDGPFITPTLSSMELYDPSTGIWTLTGPLMQARSGHTATLLPNGLVMLTGGSASPLENTLRSSTELYNPSTGTASLGASMNCGRIGHSATLLPDGTVAAVGGRVNSNFDVTNNVEIYDPRIGTWSVTNSLSVPREAHTATLLLNGEILITGGTTNNNLAGVSSTELYDPTIAPTTGSWTNISPMLTARSTFTMTVLPNGKVLVAGGQQNGTQLANCELYDPAAGTWTATGPLNHARFNHTATLLPNGKVLVVGGAGSFIGLPYPELYDPVTGTWTTNDVLSYYLWVNTATLLHNGKVLVAGVSGTNSAEVYDPNSGNWTATGPMIIPRNFHKAVSLPNGKVFVVSGIQSSNLQSAEIYDPATGQWSAAGATRSIEYDLTAAALLPNGKVLVAGYTNGSPIADLFDPATSTWTVAASPNAEYFRPSLIPMPSGKILLVGEGATPEIYDPASGQWSLTASMNLDRQDDRAVLLPDGRVLDAGGIVSDNHNEVPTSTAEIYDAGAFSTNSPRPQITSTSSPLNLGAALTVAGTGFRGCSGGSSGNFQDSSTDYPLVQLRSLESGQTTFLLTTNWSTNSFTSLPVWNFPPGQAFATVFVNGIQSTSSIVNITVPAPAMTTLKAAQISTNGSVQFAFTNNPGAVLGMLASTNLSLPSSNWTRLGGISEIAPGQFQFSDSQPANNAQNFYRLFAP